MGDGDVCHDDLGRVLVRRSVERAVEAYVQAAPRVVVDIEHWREIQDDSLIHRIKQIADVVRTSGRAYQLEPMNSYQRRVIHNAFKNDPEVMTWSPQDDARIKRITLKRRPPQ